METEKKKAEDALANFKAAVNELDGGLRPLLTALDALRATASEDELDAMSRARLHITMCYSANALFCMYLRSQGIDPTTHPVVDEITRVQEAFMRMRKVDAGRSADHQKPPDRDRRRHIQKVQKGEAKLSALVFPEERELVRALYNLRKAHGGEPTTIGSGLQENDSQLAPQEDGLDHIRVTNTEIEEMHQEAERKERKEKRKAEEKELKKSIKKKKGKKKDKRNGKKKDKKSK